MTFTDVSYAPRHALFAALCVFGVAFAAALFPAAGIDAHPGGTLERGPEGGALPDGSTPDSSLRDEQMTDEPTATDPDPTPDDIGQDPLSSPTDSSTDSPTATDVVPPDRGSDQSSGGFFGTALAVLGIGLVAVVAALRFRSTPGSRGDGGGSDSLLPGVAGSLPSLGQLPQATMTAVVRGATNIGPVLGGMTRTATGVAGGFGDAFGALGGSLRRGASLFGSLSLGLGGGAGLRGLDLPGRRRRKSPSGTDPRTAESDDPAPEEPDPGPQSVREAWAAMVERVPLDRPSVRTPGEVARAAVVAGLPADPVGRLTGLFQEVRYGGSPDDDRRLSAARRALDRFDDGGNE